MFTAQTIEISPERQLTEYIQLINAPAFDPAKLTLQKAYKTLITDCAHCLPEFSAHQLRPLPLRESSHKVDLPWHHIVLT